ncbi:MAG: hypothetical protein V3V05_08330 [Pontiella sp.]
MDTISKSLPYRPMMPRATRDRFSWIQRPRADVLEGRWPQRPHAPSYPPILTLNTTREYFAV